MRVADLFNPPKRSRRPKLQHEPLLVRASSLTIPMKSVAIATVVLLAASASAFAPPANPITVKSSTATANTALNAVWDD